MNSTQSKSDNLLFNRSLLKIHLKAKRKSIKESSNSHLTFFPFPHPLTLYLYSRIKFSPYPFWVPIIIFIDSLWKTILPPPFILPYRILLLLIYSKLRTFFFGKVGGRWGVFIYYLFISFFSSLRMFVRSFLSRADK